MEGGVKLGQWDRGETYAHNIIGDLNAGVTLWLDWNMILDIQGGPNHVGNYCDAPVIADLDADTVHYQSSYAYIGHFSRYIHTGAMCLFCELSDPSTELEVSAFQNIDGSVVCVILNRGDADTSASLQAKWTNDTVNAAIPAHSITTVTNEKVEL
ncbi:MAG: glycoside hydrolase family 30 protein [Spirochaetia bacterium]|nr:glycoside hydrolase family 30 protein [Spirochaetia bacterium]